MDYPGEKLPSVTGGELEWYLLDTVAPQVGAGTAAALDSLGARGLGGTCWTRWRRRWVGAGAAAAPCWIRVHAWQGGRTERLQWCLLASSPRRQPSSPSSRRPPPPAPTHARPPPPPPAPRPEQVPPELRPSFEAAVKHGRIRCMQNKQVTSQPLHPAGALLLGDAFNMRHPLTGAWGRAAAGPGVVEAGGADRPPAACAVGSCRRCKRGPARWPVYQPPLASPVGILLAAGGGMTAAFSDT